MSYLFGLFGSSSPEPSVNQNGAAANAKAGAPVTAAPDPVQAVAAKATAIGQNVSPQVTAGSYTATAAQNVSPEQAAIKAKGQTAAPDANTVDGVSQISRNTINEIIRPNILDSYASYTYHIRWSLTSENDAGGVINGGNDRNFRNGVNKIVIAESGTVALYSIAEMTIETLMPGSPTTPQTTDKQIHMTITEPYGLTLIDNLFNASRSIGIQNYTTTQAYFIELWFQGYNEDGSIGQELQNVYKLFNVQLKTLEADSTESGTTYKLVFLLQNQFAHADHVSAASSSVQIGPVTTVGQFFNQYADRLTAINAELYDDKLPRIKYVINPGILASYQFDRSPTTNQRSNTTADLNANNPTIQIARGMDITTVTNFVVSMTKQGQKLYVGESETQNGAGTTSGASLKVNGMTNLVIIHTKTSTGVWDPQCNDYVRTVTYTLKKYPTGRAIGDLKNAANTRKPEVQSARQAAMSQSHNFIKHYYYTYTGKNLDVSKFELKINITNQLGILNNLGNNLYDNYTVGPLLNNTGVGYKTLNQTLPNTPGTVVPNNNVTRAGDSTTVATAVGAAATAAVNQQLTSATATIQQQSAAAQAAVNNTPAYQMAINKPANQRTNADRAVISAGQKIISSTAASSATPIVSKSAPPTPVTLQRRLSYLEDVGTPLFDPNPFPISGRANSEPVVQNSIGGGVGDNQDASSGTSAANTPPSRGLVASILNECSGQGFVNQKLEIRGDPYWLGFGNILENALVGDGTQTPAVAAAKLDSVWILDGDVGYIFTLRTGQSYNESIGLMDFNGKTISWDGYYKVIKVTSTFKGGVFTQVLESIKDILTDPPSTQTNNTPNAIQTAVNAAAANINKNTANTVNNINRAAANYQ